MKAAFSNCCNTSAPIRSPSAFFEADAGISGVNFAVAETGTLCLVENEGNGRMSTHVPPVHIALMGIEKVVENQVPLERKQMPWVAAVTRFGSG